MQQQSDDEDRPALRSCSDADKDSDFESVKNTLKYKYSETTKLKMIRNKQTGKHSAEQSKQSRFGKIVSKQKQQIFFSEKCILCSNMYEQLCFCKCFN